AYTIIGDKLIRLPQPGSVAPAANTAANWIKHYQDKIPALNQHGSQTTGNAGYKETKSLWYAMNLFTGSGGRPGLVSYINSQQKDPNPIVSVDAQLACYTGNDDFPQHQLTLVFNLRRKNSQPPAAATQAAGAASPAAAHAAVATTNVAHAMDDPTDMGMPCPPDTVCNGGGGSIFP
ncbi:MAG TPA: hypothetical protein VNU72_04245, partial [Puia sp.]|nr:hypothetical protein [Puia sp.]